MDEERVTQAHALLLPVPFRGHINPFMELGERLVSLGVRVTLVTTQPLHAKILRARAHQPITARHAHFALVGLPDGLTDRPHSLLDVLHAVDNLHDPVLELVHTLASQGFPVTCIVADYFLRWSPSLASRTCLPEFIFWLQCASVFSIYLHVDSFIAAGYDPFDNNETAAALGRDPMDKVWCIPASLSHQHIRYTDLPFQGFAWKETVEWSKEVMTHRLKHLPKAQGVLVNSFEALDAEVSKALAAELQELIIPNTSPSLLRLIGPLTALACEGSTTRSLLWEEEVEECMQWLDGKPPASVIFIAFGSLAIMSCKAQVQELAEGLIASGKQFLWVLRKDAIKIANSEDSIIKIEDALPHGFLEKTKGMGKVVHWAPQPQVLSHPSIGAFFSHCGWNSILESINAGVPILGWPSFADQFPNCRLVSHVWRMGLELQRNELNETTRAYVSNGIRELMDGPHAQDMLAQAMQLKKFAQEAMHSSCHLLDFVDDINKIAASNVCTRLES